MHEPLPLSQLNAAPIRAVFTDLDDTLTERSKIHASTFAALWRLQERGYFTAIVSGRPAGWADCLMRLWPLDAMVFENGAGIIYREGEKLVRHNLASDKNHQEQQRYLETLFQNLKKKIPQLRLATDQAFRLFDYAIDYCEEPPTLSPSEVADILSTLEKDNSVTSKLSSIHINYWYGKHTKVTACKFLLEKMLEPRGIQSPHVIFSGDSPNDEPLFAFFENSIGVENIRHFLPRMQHPPRFITTKPHGAGFEEIVQHLLGNV